MNDNGNDRTKSNYWARKVADIKATLREAQRQLDLAVQKEDAHIYKERMEKLGCPVIKDEVGS